LKELEAIESRFGIKLPSLYRELAENERLDYRGKNFYEMPDCLWLTPKELAKFKWEKFRKPVDGLVPFATNGGGDYFCWYLPEVGLDGEPVVMECAHDCYDGRWFAPSMAGCVYRQTLERFSKFDDEHADQITEVLNVLDKHAAETWCDTLRVLQGADPLPYELEDEDVLSVNAIAKLVCQAFGDKYVDQDFTWDKDGLE